MGTAVAVVAASVTAIVAGSGAAAQAQPAATSLYIVQMAGAPLATYTGTEAGLAATAPASGSKLDAGSPAARAYRTLLASRRNDLLRRQGIQTPQVYQYSTVFNGFAIQLTAAQALKMRQDGGVVNVWKNRLVSSQTFTTPTFVGLDGKNGAWKKEFGDPKRAGEGVIIGVIDSGLWPENPSFGPLPTPRPDQTIIDAKWHGTCDPGVEAPVACNNKVIGARWFNAGNLSHANPNEYDSPRDFFGHGSHTAGTAGGDFGVTATINGNVAGVLSGMAPAARLAIYKVLYADAADARSVGSTADIVAAINQAVEDGVDVINFSVGDDVDQFGPDELSFLNAASAGVFISAAAGNAGPGAGTVDNAMPWETTVAAGTHDRSYSASVTLGNGATYQGVGLGAAVASSPLVYAGSAALPGANPTEAAQCVSSGRLDPAKVTGKIVLCDRGNNARVDKSLAVQQAGGVGMILRNLTPNSLNADYHLVPTVHVDQVAGAAIRTYADTPGATASLGAGKQITVEAPQVAAFSSRGPSPSSRGDLLKPDIMAPGVDVVAAVAPPNHNGNLWDTDSGTSMATPHVAGIAALLISKHPNWSPMAVKSALMTTASVTDNQRKAIGDQATGAKGTPLDFGAGEVTAGPAFDPGLVYDSGPTQWLQYSCGIGVHLIAGNGSDVCDTVGTVDPSDFNSPTVAVGDLAGTQTLTRTVTNVDDRAGVYVAKVSAPKGFTVKVSPPALVLPPHRSATFKVTIKRTTAPLGEYGFGSLTWVGIGNHQVRSTIAVRPVALAAPDEAAGSGASGSAALSVRAGYAGTLTATGFGLAASAPTHFSLTQNPATPFDPDAPAETGSTGEVGLTVPVGTKVARVATFAADYPAGTDIDLYVYAQDADGTLTLVDLSAGGTADEKVTLTEPGQYVVFVDLFAAVSASPVDVVLNSWVVPSANAGNLTVAPASQTASVGAALTVTASWSGLAPGRYLGLVEYGDGTQTIGSTVLSVTS